MDADNLRVDGFEGIIGEAKLRGFVPPEVVGNNISLFHKTMQHLLPFLVLQVQRE